MIKIHGCLINLDRIYNTVGDNATTSTSELQ